MAAALRLRLAFLGDAMVPLDENTAATTPYIADPPRAVSDELFDSSQVPAGCGLIVTVRNQQELDALDIDSLPAGSVINLASHQAYDFKHRDTTGLQVLISDISVPEPPAPSPCRRLFGRRKNSGRVQRNCHRCRPKQDNRQTLRAVAAAGRSSKSVVVRSRYGISE